VDTTSLAPLAQEAPELVECFRHEGDDCPRCDGSGFRHRKRCEGCGEPAGRPSEGGKALMAYNTKGYENLSKLITAYKCSFEDKRKPSCPFFVLLEHAEGLVCLTGLCKSRSHRHHCRCQPTQSQPLSLWQPQPQ
jgi:hypothetical protein